MTVPQTATQPDSTREIIARCRRECRIRYKSKGDTFFRLRLRGINHLHRTRKPIVIADASSDERSRSQLYVVKRRPICVPILNRGRLAGRTGTGHTKRNQAHVYAIVVA